MIYLKVHHKLSVKRVSILKWGRSIKKKKEHDEVHNFKKYDLIRKYRDPGVSVLSDAIGGASGYGGIWSPLKRTAHGPASES